MEPAERPVNPGDIHATVCHALGIDHERRFTRRRIARWFSFEKEQSRFTNCSLNVQKFFQACAAPLGGVFA